MKVRSLMVAGVALAAFMIVAVPSGFAEGTKVNVTGHVMSKTEKKDGKDVATTQIHVVEAKGSDGKAIADLANKMLDVTGAKVAAVAALKDKEVTASGTVSADKKSIDVDSVAAKAADKK